MGQRLQTQHGLFPTIPSLSRIFQIAAVHACSQSCRIRFGTQAQADVIIAIRRIVLFSLPHPQQDGEREIGMPVPPCHDGRNAPGLSQAIQRAPQDIGCAEQPARTLFGQGGFVGPVQEVPAALQKLYIEQTEKQGISTDAAEIDLYSVLLRQHDGNRPLPIVRCLLHLGKGAFQLIGQ